VRAPQWPGRGGEGKIVFQLFEITYILSGGPSGEFGMKVLFGKTFDLLSDMLDLHARRHKVLTSNIVNIDTPNYEPKDLDFDKALQGASASRLAMKGTDRRHLRTAAPGQDFSVVTTGRRVSLDKEMVNLAENHLMYNTAVELLARKFKSLNTVLKEVK
jgi:flagellar basal-body rod protein FlgB